MKKILYFLIILFLVVVTAILILNYVGVFNNETKDVSKPTKVINISDVTSKNECDLFENLTYVTYTDSNSSKNNKVGLYVYAERQDYIEAAAELVNSNGGDYGYVLIPYNMNDRDYSRWNRVFKQLEELHLIPIINLNALDIEDAQNQTKQAAQFLNSFVWPIRERYITVYNEPNDARFWYERVDPKEYAEILNLTIDIFKNENENFKMLNGALNVSATSGYYEMDAFDYMYYMNKHVPGIFNKLDGWASHSYPQPNFAGDPYAIGRNSIKAYETELSYLKQLGVQKDLPVFITETGWAHAEGENYSNIYLPQEQTAQYFKIAYEQVWLPDDRVVAVTPFTIWYKPPFDHFSWLDNDGQFYKQYEVVKSIPKVQGEPNKLVYKEVLINTCE